MLFLLGRVKSFGMLFFFLTARSKLSEPPSAELSLSMAININEMLIARLAERRSPDEGLALQRDF